MTSIAKSVIGLEELGFTTRGSWKTLGAGLLRFLALAFYAVYLTAPAWDVLGVGRSIFIHVYGIPRPELEQSLLSRNPVAHQVLFGMHPIVDLSHFVLALIGVTLLWGLGDRLRTNRIAQAAFVVVVLLTYFSISLTLGFHSALVRINAG